MHAKECWLKDAGALCVWLVHNADQRGPGVVEDQHECLQAPFKDRPEYVHATKLAEDIADLLAPQSGAYYDIWLDGEKYVSSQMEVCTLLTKDSCSLWQHMISLLSL